MDKCRALDDVGREPAVLPSSEDEVSTLPGTIVEVVTLPGSLLEEASFSGFESERMATLVGSQQQAAGAGGSAGTRSLWRNNSAASTRRLFHLKQQPGARDNDERTHHPAFCLINVSAVMLP